MKPAENVEKLIKHVEVDTNAETDEAVLDDLLKAWANSRRKKSASAAPSIRRTIMKSRITKLTAAAIIIIAVLIGLKMLSGSDEKPNKQIVKPDVSVKREVELAANTLDSELENVERLFEARDVDGLVAMLSEGQFETKVAVADYLAKMNAVEALEPLEKLNTAYARHGRRNPFAPALEKIKNHINTTQTESRTTASTEEATTSTGDYINTRSTQGPVTGESQLPPIQEVTNDSAQPLEQEEVSDAVTVQDELVEVDSPTCVKHTVASGFSGEVIYPTDIDGDGDLDVVGAVRDPGAITWWENTDGEATAWTEHTVDANFGGSIDAFPADVDGDGDVDIVGSDRGASDIVWWENSTGDGKSWTKRPVEEYSGSVSDTIFGDVDSVQLVYAADMDGDRDIDVVGATWLGHGITWWENANGNGTTWTRHPVDPKFFRTHCLRLADMDGDGNLDIVASAGRESGINWWENPTGDGEVWTWHYVVGSDGEVESVFPADIDGDGDTDLAGSIRRRDGLTWWENTNGAGTEWVKHVIDSTYTGEQGVDAVDMDNDGDLDILGAALRINSTIWWENVNGDGTTWAKRVVSRKFALGPYAVYMDGDGDFDMLGVAYDADEIAWLENPPTLWEDAEEPPQAQVTPRLSFSSVIRSDAPGPSPDSEAAADANDKRARDLFGGVLQKGISEVRRFDFRWSDIRVLLELAQSQKVLTRVPSNPLSSYIASQCRQGMVALWLIEGLRKAQLQSASGFTVRHLPSFHPFCVKEGGRLRDFENSPEIHAEVLEAYQNWWEQVWSLPPKQAAAVEPLDGTDLHW